MSFITDDLKIPTKLVHPDFIARKLTINDLYLDYIAVMSSIDIIQKTRGGNWPTKDLTIEQDLAYLGWHQKEFDSRSTFAYTVMNQDESTCLGCFYLYPPGTRAKANKNAEVDVSFWVTTKAYEQGLYQTLYKALDKWLEAEWNFNNIQYTNTEIPN